MRPIVIAVAADDTVYISDVNAGIVNIVKNGKLIDSVAADRAHGMGIDTDGRSMSPAHRG